jgi:hypothetical protein
MTALDRLAAAVSSTKNERAQAEARAKARMLAVPGDWLSMILDHHHEVEAAFAAVRKASSEAARAAAHKELVIILTGHAIAEESVIYPALAEVGEKGHAGSAYTEQAALKMQMALLEKLPPMSPDYEGKLEHIRGAVAHHMCEEEGSWFLELKNKASAAEQGRLAARYRQEFVRYTQGADTTPAFESKLADGM